MVASDQDSTVFGMPTSAAKLSNTMLTAQNLDLETGTNYTVQLAAEVVMFHGSQIQPYRQQSARGHNVHRGASCFGSSFGDQRMLKLKSSGLYTTQYTSGNVRVTSLLHASWRNFKFFTFAKSIGGLIDIGLMN